MRSLLPAGLAVLAAGAANANPRRPECKPYNSVVSELKREKATPFCSSYLHMKCSTTTKTCTTPTTTTVTVAPTTTTVTVKNPTSTVTNTIPTSTTVTSPTADCANIPAMPVPIGTGALGGGVVRREASPAAPNTIPTPKCLKGYNPSKISTACGCMNIPTRTEAVTAHKYPVVTHTVTSATAATQTTLDTTDVTVTTTFATYTCACTDPPGWEFALYNNPYSYRGAPGDHSDAPYVDFKPQDFKTIAPYATGTTEQQSGSFDFDQDPSPITIYGKDVEDPQAVVINQRGYFKAPATDQYTFTIQDRPNDIELLWISGTAVTGWTRGNADQWGTLDLGSSQAVTIPLLKGAHLATRFVWGQTEGPDDVGSWSLKVTDSAGNDVTAGNFVQNNCNPATYNTEGGAPYAQPFGSES